MKKVTLLVLVLMLSTVAVVAAALRGPSPDSGIASSHREAPLISEDPSADLTDVYAFRSPDKPDTVTILANVIPAEDPAAGPMYYTFSPSARYNIKIDRNGDTRPDLTYSFRFRRGNGPFFLGNTVQPYTLSLNGKVIARGSTPPNNIGPRTLKTLYNADSYRELAAKSVKGLPGGGSMFAGQRDDPFFADIGAIFDLLAIRKGTGNVGGGRDFFAGYAVHTLALQIPISKLNAKASTIGVVATVERQNVTVNGKVRKGFSQVNRMANPLVNEVLIGTPLKDAWNRGAPQGDGKAPFLTFYEKPILAAVINQLYKLGAPETGRDDLVAVFLTGVPKLNFTGATRAELLRLNYSIPVTAAPNRLGVLGGDNQGWPNGRRLKDDVIDIAEQAVGGFLKGKKLPLGDGVNTDDAGGLGFFPYAGDPADGFTNNKGEPTP